MNIADLKRALHFAAKASCVSSTCSLCRNLNPASQRLARRALTLLELMVVLVILAVVSTVALQTLQPRVETERLNSATRLINEIKAASIGPTQKYQIDGTPLISGFIADVGRYPRAESFQADLESVSILEELWDPESDLARSFPFQFRPGPNQPADYSKIRLPCGWRGPYLQLSLGINSLKDPWGRVPETILDSRGFCEQVCIPAITTSDQSEKLLVADLTAGKVQVTGKVLVDNPDNANVRVSLLTPDPGTSLTTLVAMDDEDEQSDSFLFQSVPVGFRAIVADAEGRRQTKYIQVTHNGATVLFDFRQQNTEAEN